MRGFTNICTKMLHESVPILFCILIGVRLVVRQIMSYEVINCFALQTLHNFAATL